MSDKDAIPLGGIIGIAVAGVGLIIVAVYILYLLCVKYSKKQKQDNKKEDVVYAEVGDYDGNTGDAIEESSHYAKVEFKKSGHFKEEKKKVKEAEKQKTGQGPVYAEITPQQMPPPPAESPEPRYANINMQSSV